MPEAALRLCVPEPGQGWSDAQITAMAPCLEKLSAQERVRWALAYLPPRAILTSSFGAQSAVMLHLVTGIAPDIPVVLIDTGYLFAETYAFVERLQRKLDLNLKVYRAELSAPWQESRYGKLWEQGVEGIQRYNHINKVEPMQRALDELSAGTWFSGLRRQQSRSRRELSVLQRHGEITKLHPLADWTDRDIHAYLKDHGLPYHPLWEQGYVSIGDHHTSRPIGANESAEDTRYFGLLRECGLHQPEHYPPRRLTG